MKKLFAIALLGLVPLFNAKLYTMDHIKEHPSKMRGSHHLHRQHVKMSKDKNNETDENRIKELFDHRKKNSESSCCPLFNACAAYLTAWSNTK